MYEWTVYLAGVEKMDIFEAIPMEYKIVAIVLGVSLLILDYLKKYYEATEKDPSKFDSSYLLSMICAVAIGGLASYVVVFQMTGAFLGDMVIENTIVGVLVIAGLSALTAFVVDRVLFHQMGDIMYQGKKKRAKNAPVKETDSIVQTIINTAKGMGMVITDPSAIKKAVLDALVKGTVEEQTGKKPKHGKDFDPYKE